MVKKIFLLVGIVLLLGCEKEFYDLKLKRVPYTGNELRIDGYYYSDKEYNSYYNIAVFFRNGVCIKMYTYAKNQDTIDFDYIEKDILLNKSLIKSFMETPTNVGVFQITDESIEYEYWADGRDIITFSHFGKILNDTTFLRTKYINNQSGTEYSKKLLFHFRKFSPKPDSICPFIE